MAVGLLYWVRTEMSSLPTPPQLLATQMRAVLDASPDGVLVEVHDRIIYINDSYARFLGYHSSRDLWGATVQDIAHPEEVDQLNFFGRRRELGQPAPERYVLRAIRKDRNVASFDATVWTTRSGLELLIATTVRPHVDEDPASRPEPEPGLKRLSPREGEVFTMLLAGRRSKEIAFTLGISEKTVGTLRSRIYNKLALRGDLDLFRFAASHGLLEPSRSVA